MHFKRRSGIILHPTSLPGPDGIGDLGPEAYRWVDWLAESGCSLWQVLPMGPTGYGDSPYQCFSAFAGNPYLISPVVLMEEGLLKNQDIKDRPNFPSDHVDFGSVIPWKLALLDRAFRNFRKSRNTRLKSEFQVFQETEKNWLNDFVRFMSIKSHFGGVSWAEWPEPFHMMEPKIIDEFAQKHQIDLEKEAFKQFMFFKQWSTLKDYSNKKGIQIIGDIPIFVAFDSSDAWSHPELFHFTEKRFPRVVAGVPPDYFSPTGQLWGNPLYKWDIHRNTGFAWWKARIHATLKFFDILRLDHFRGFAGYWEIPAGNPTAEIGRWVKGPGVSLFQEIKKELGDLPIIAEDLGEITPDVIALREKFGLPGMKIFQFAFSSTPADPFLPHNYVENCIAYTGTHDNDTALGWYTSAPEKEQDFCRRYLARSGDDISWDMIRAIWSSIAIFGLAPMQDILSLPNQARMNFPGTLGNNWIWRMQPDAISEELKIRLREMNFLYSRINFD